MGKGMNLEPTPAAGPASTSTRPVPRGARRIWPCAVRGWAARARRVAVVAAVLGALSGWAAGAVPAPVLATSGQTAAAEGMAGGVVQAMRSSLGNGSAEALGGPPASVSSRQALVPALMSAVVPGSGQLRNGSVIKGIAFAAVELTGWMAWLSFRHQESNKFDDIKSFGGRYWEYERYRKVAQDADSCVAYGCPCGLYSTSADSLILLARDQGGSRLYDYLTRDAYACGWDSRLSRDLYLGLHDDREDLLDAKRLTGRLILLNHVVAAVDAFLQARRVSLAGVADLGVEMAGLPRHPHPQLTFTARWD